MRCGDCWEMARLTLWGVGFNLCKPMPVWRGVKDDFQRVIALIVAMGQATYGFAPAVFAAVLMGSSTGAAQIGNGSGTFLAAVAAVQALAIASFLSGRRRA